MVPTVLSACATVRLLFVSEIHPSQDTSDLKIGFRWDRPQTERADVRLDSPQLDDLAKRNRDRQRRLEERKKGAQ